MVIFEMPRILKFDITKIKNLKHFLIKKIKFRDYLPKSTKKKKESFFRKR
jgi:hypothetical protein